MVTIIATPPHALITRSQPAAATNYAPTKRAPSLIVLHSTEGREGGGNTDANVAAGIGKPLPQGSRKSFHFVIDADSVTECVAPNLVAWHCGRTGNARGIGVEICGSASQTREQWLDAVSLATLCNAARLVATLCTAHQIPPVLLSASMLKLPGARGITTHAAVSEAWAESTHWDPGPGFPLADFVAAVDAALSSTGQIPP